MDDQADLRRSPLLITTRLFIALLLGAAVSVAVGVALTQIGVRERDAGDEEADCGGSARKAA